MLKASVLDLSYHRYLAENLTTELAEKLTQKDDYSFVVCYGMCNASQYQSLSKKACLIDLRDGVDTAFSRFHTSTRRQVRRAETIEGLEFYSDYGSDFDAYFSFYKQCENERGWFPVPESELKGSLLFSASFEGKWISGMSCYSHGTRLRVGRIFTRKRQEQSELLNDMVYGCAAKRIVFNICQYAFTQGFETLDLSGIDPDDPAKAGITRFKMSFGGTVVPVQIARYANEKFRANEHLIREHGYDIT